MANPIVDGHRVCLNCGIRKAANASHFYVSNGVFRAICRTCSATHSSNGSHQWRLSYPKKASARSAAWNAANPLRSKACKAVNTMRRSLKERGREGEETASTDELETSLRLYLADFNILPTRDNLKDIDNCHGIALALGGSCTAENLFWGWHPLNTSAGSAHPETVIARIRDYLYHMESAQAQAALRATQNGGTVSGAVA